MSAAQVLRQAESLKVAVQDTSHGANEAWVSRQHLQDLYQKLLVLDLEYALDKKVEQDLWNHAFKNQINTLQTQAKDKQNPKRPEIVASLNLFLETASGFYIQLLEELCSAFKLDLPCRRKSSTIGILKEYGPVAKKIKNPKKSSSMYICQHCLVHLGDIARYREQSDQAQTYYKHAASLVPYNGQPYNQLAILEAAKGNKLATVVYYVRSIAVKHPFPVACTNLEKLYAKITREIPETGRKLSMSELTIAFLQFNALVHLCNNLERARGLCDKIQTSLPSHITSMSFTSHQLIQMITINLFTMHHAKRRLTDQSEASTENEEPRDKKEELGLDEQKGYDMVFNLTISLLELLLHLTPKQETKVKEYHTLPAIKILLDWIRTDTEIISSTNDKLPSVCQNLSKLLNNLQFNPNQKDAPNNLEKYVSVPLPEDNDLRCFLALLPAQSELDFHAMSAEGLSPEVEMRMRCQRLVEHGLWLCEEFPSLNLMNVVKQKSGRLYFSSPSSPGKMSSGTDPERPTEKKSSYRQNVAIQAIMQNKAKKDSTPVLPIESKESSQSNKPIPTPSNPSKHSKSPGTARRSSSQEKPSKKEPITEKTPKKSDAGIMAHSATDTQEPKEKPIPPDAWTRPEPSHPSTSYMDWPRPRGPAPPFMPGGARLPQEVPPRGMWPPQILPRNPGPPFFVPGSDSQQSDKENCDFPFPTKGQGCLPDSEQQQVKELDDPAVVSFSKDGSQRIMGNIPRLPPFFAPDSSKGVSGVHLSNAEELKQEQLKRLQLQKMHQQLQHGILGKEAQVQQQWLQQQHQHQPTPQQQQRPKMEPTFEPPVPGFEPSVPGFEQSLSQLDDQVARTSQHLEQVGQMMQQKLQAMQQDPELLALQQQLTQLQLQKKNTMDPRQQQQLKVMISQNQQKAVLLIQQYQDDIARQQLLQQQVHHQMAELQRQRHDLLERVETPQRGRGEWGDDVIPVDDRLPSNQLPSDPLPSNMDLSEMLAVLEMIQGDKLPWGNHGDLGNAADDVLRQGQGGIFASEKSGQSSPPAAFWVPKERTGCNPDTYSQFGKSNPSETAKSFLESLLSGTFRGGDQHATDGAYIPESDSEEELRQVTDDIAPFGEKSASDLLLSSNFPVSMAMGVEFSPLAEVTPKPDTPPSMYSRSQTTGVDSNATNTYSLFSQSPWTVQLTSADNRSHPTSPFGSSNSSVRTTPDPYSSQSDDRITPGSSIGGHLGLGYNYGAANTTTSGDNWGAPQAAVPATGGATVAHANIQNLWPAGPSPLQKLLEQQKNQRQNDPH